MPIKEKIINELKKGAIKYKKLQAKFKASKKFFSAIDELYNEGLIEESNGFVRLVVKKNKKESRNNENLFLGTLVKLTENFGFVRLEGEEKDVFVSGRLLMGRVPGDEVLIKKIPSEYRDFEGEVVDIKTEKENLVAFVTYSSGRMKATLKDCPYVSMKVENRVYASEDDVVLVNIHNRGTSHRNLTCEITAVIGKISSSQKAVEVLLAEKGVETDFPKNVLSRAMKAVKGSDFEKEAAKREDFTNLPIFTIDSASTKDIDDAIHIEKTENGFILGVHIADVSHYVKGGSENDSDAYKRGTSIYFGNSVIPMLPQVFSNDVCSLNEKVRRLAFSCIINLDNQGNIKKYRFVKSVIKSRVKGVYSEINSILAKNATPALQAKYALVYDELETLRELYELLRAKHIRRGSMDIESDEAYIVFDNTGKAVDVEKRERGLSEMMIEEFMLLANTCSANFAKKNNLPFIYRIHEEPSQEKMDDLKVNLSRIGLSLDVQNGKSLQQSMSDLLDKTRGTNLETVVHKMVLRAQSKAKYSDEKIGHFGLVLEDYSHFTSPIRRYSDLAIHRIMSDYLAGNSVEKITKRYEKFADSRANQASKTELVAMNVERSADDIYKAEIMSDKVGRVYTGTVSGVMSYGVYVMLNNTIEGLVHVSQLDMISPQLTEGYSLSCPYTGRKYVIGDEITVKVLGADILEGNVDFTLYRESDDQITPAKAKVKIASDTRRKRELRSAKKEAKNTEKVKAPTHKRAARSERSPKLKYKRNK